MNPKPNYTERLVKDRNHPYVQVSRDLAQDSELSFAARGLMIYLLSKPDGWVVRMTDLDNASPAGRTATRNALKELLDTGYLTRRFVRFPRGNLEWITMIHESPVEPIPVNKEPIAIRTVDDLPPTTPRKRDTVHGERGSLVMNESVMTEEKDATHGAAAPEGCATIFPLAESSGGNEPVIDSKKKNQQARKRRSVPKTRPLEMGEGGSAAKPTHGAFYSALKTVTELDDSIKTNRGRLNRAAKELRESGHYTPDDVLYRFGAASWWYTVDFRGKAGKKPTPEWVLKHIGEAVMGGKSTLTNSDEPHVYYGV